MMCKNCDFKHIYEFESETSWIEFDLDFTKKFITQLTLLNANKLNPASYRSYSLYKCNSCGDLWAYSDPDNAWRGFFLPEILAIKYEKKLKWRDRIKGFIGVIILILIIMVVVKSCMN